MKQLTILAFGIARDIFGSGKVALPSEGIADVQALKAALEEKYPALKALASYMIAVNETYAGAGDAVREGDEIAVIPPVSGG
jgi:molybdopterin synthase sulfur carrier subunit